MKKFPPELAHGSGAVMTLDRSRLLLAFQEPQDAGAVAKMLRDLDLVLEERARRGRRARR